MEKSRGRSLDVQASFDFTIGASYQPPEPSEVVSKPSYQPISPTIEPTSETPSEFVPESEAIVPTEKGNAEKPADTITPSSAPNGENQPNKSLEDDNFSFNENNTHAERRENLSLFSLAGCIGGAITLIVLVVWVIKKLITKK